MFMRGLNLTDPARRAGSWSPARLFSSTDRGIFLAVTPGLLSQDSGGTTPATSPGQPVGLVRRMAGTVDAAQVVSAARPTLGRHPRAGLRNLVVNSAALASGGWSGGSGLLSVADAVALGPGGQMTAARLIETTAASASRNRVQSVTCIAETSYTLSAIAKSSGPQIRHLSLVCENSTVFGGTPAATLNMVTGAITQSGGVERTAGAVDLGNGWWRFWMRAKCVTSGLNGFRIGFGADPISAGASYTGDGLSGIAVEGVQIETGPAMTAYQRTTSAYDVTEADQPDAWYLAADGIDDYLSTSAITWGTDEVTVIAALRKRSDAAEGRVANFGAVGQAGSWQLGAPGGGADKAYIVATGTAQSAYGATNAAFAAPLSMVMTGTAKIATDALTLRINGAVAGTRATDMGSGIFGTRGMQIGASAVPDRCAAMDLYGLLAINRLLTPTELALAERYMAKKCGVTLP